MIFIQFIIKSIMNHRTLYLLFLIVLATSTASDLKFQTSAYMIPHPDKIEKGGEDAFFQSKELLIVADGVGGWNAHGIDPSLYSKFLCSAAQVYFNENPLYYTKSPQSLIEKASENNRFPGSSTMSVVTLQKALLRSCHIGDCKLIVLRKYEQYRPIFETMDQLHGFNFPYQLASKKYGGDDPSLAICSALKVQKGDIAVLYSDGLADNVYPYQIVKIIAKSIESNSLKETPKKLAKLATERAKKKTGNSPFGDKAKQWGIDYTGGKVDDTTVIVALITTDEINEIAEL